MLIKITFLLITILFSLKYALACKKLEMKYFTVTILLIILPILGMSEGISSISKKKCNNNGIKNYSLNLETVFKNETSFPKSFHSLSIGLLRPTSLIAFEYDCRISVIKGLILIPELGVGVIPGMPGHPFWTTAHININSGLLICRPLYVYVGLGRFHDFQWYKNDALICQGGFYFTFETGFMLKACYWQTINLWYNYRLVSLNIGYTLGGRKKKE